MKNIVAKNIKDLFQIYCAENIFIDNKYIFVPSKGRFDANIFSNGIFDANILSLNEKKKMYLQRDIRSKFMSYISL